MGGKPLGEAREGAVRFSGEDIMIYRVYHESIRYYNYNKAITPCVLKI